MGKPEMNSPHRYFSVLALVLVAALLVLCTGVSYARYRADIKEGWQMTPKALEQVYLCHVDAEGSLTDAPASWNRTEDGYQMNFCLANGDDWGEHATWDQQVSLRVLAGSGMLNGDSGAKVDLTVLDADGNGNAAVYRGVAVAISGQSSVYTTFGPGWEFRFVDDEGEELSWELEGGKLDVRYMRLDVSGVQLQEEVLLQLQVVGK